MAPKLPLSPARIAQECLCLGLRRASRALSRRYDEALAPLDLNNGQFSMLAQIAGHQPVGMQVLAEHLAMDRTTVTAALKPLQRRGLVGIEPSETDLRGRVARLTPEGHALFVKAAARWQHAQEAALARLAPQGGAKLLEQLARVN